MSSGLTRWPRLRSALPDTSFLHVHAYRGGRNTFYYRPGHHPMGDEMFGAGTICSKSNSEHLPGNSEHLDTLRNIAEPIRSLRKAPRERVEAMIFRLCESRYLTLDELADLLDRRKDSLRNHYITPMLEDGRILSGSI